MGNGGVLEKDFRVETTGLDFLVLIPLFSVSFFRSLIVVLFLLFCPRGAVYKDPTLALWRRQRESSLISSLNLVVV
jgi:hypothetical protein